MSKRLTITEIDSVGAVDEPDNPPAMLSFWKRLTGRKDTPDPGDATREGVLMPDEPIMQETAEEVGKQEPAEIAEAPVEEPVEDLAKRALEEEVAKAHAERDAAVALLAQEIAKARQAEWISKAKPYEPLLGPADEIGPALGRIADLLPDEYARLEQAFKAALARQDLAGIITKEIGKDTGETGTAEEQRDRWVKDYLTKNPEKTQGQARDLFWRSHPELKKASRERI